MPGWLIHVTTKGGSSTYAVWVVGEWNAVQMIARRLGVSPETIEIKGRLSDRALERLGAQPGRIASVAVSHN